MVQFKAVPQPKPTPACLNSLDRGSRQAVAAALKALGRPGASPEAVVRTQDGTPVYVVVAERIRDEFPSTADVVEGLRLTLREAQVAVLLGKRLTSQEIADELGVTVHTARRHTEQVLEKMGLGNRMAVRAALLALAAKVAKRNEDIRQYEQARRARRLQAVAA